MPTYDIERLGHPVSGKTVMNDLGDVGHRLYRIRPFVSESPVQPRALNAEHDRRHQTEQRPVRHMLGQVVANWLACFDEIGDGSLPGAGVTHPGFGTVPVAGRSATSIAYGGLPPVSE